MAETSYPIADGSGVTDATYEKLVGPLTGAGRYGFTPSSSALSTPLVYGDSSGRQVKVNANQAAIVRGFRWESGTSPVTVALDANTSGNPRYDLIVLRLTRATYQVRLAKITGTPAASPAAPAPVQDEGSTGVWDLPVARVRVISSGVSGQPLIPNTEVTTLDWWVGPPPITCASAASPPLTHGQLVHHTDTNRTYRSVGSSLVLLGERGALTDVAPAAGWTSSHLSAQRVNGFVYFQGLITLSAANKAANTDITVCTLPTTFRPEDGNDISGVGWMSPNQVCQVYVDGPTGTVSVFNYPSTFPTGGSLTIHPMTWPAAS